MKNKLGLIKRLSILAVLLFCLGFVTFTPRAQPALASQCCSECLLPPPFDVEYVPEFCTDHCGGPSAERTCVENCIEEVNDCAAQCDRDC
jgi:hypothetical protein